jgi:glycosyltransferase involved in cell wall biosynthesis
MAAPKVSIIIPNFDNGRASSRSGRDLLGELFASLQRTLAAESVPFEILVADDGSTDDSLETCRAWSQRRWADGRPFLRLIELDHSGVLSRVLNVLERESSGEFLARLDGDIVLLTERWLTPLVAMFERDARLGVVTAAQLLPDGRVHAFGDDLWGPRGYRHIANGTRLKDLPHEREVDHAMGCFYVTRRVVHERIGGYDESVLRGQTEEYGVRVRLDGWRVMATSRVAFEHWHIDRLPRANRADRPETLDGSLDRFREKWGFDRLAPDLTEVRSRYATTPLWWRDHASGGATAPADEWQRLGSDAALTRRLTEEIEFVGRAIQAASGRCRVTQIGSGCGTLAVSLARMGAEAEGIELAGPAQRSAEAAATTLPQPRPSFVTVDDLGRLPIDDRSRPIVALLGIIERAWNPVGVVSEARRIVSERGVVLVRSALRTRLLDDPDEVGHRFTADELLSFIRHIGGLELFGVEPRIVSASHSIGEDWFECVLRAVPIERGRGYFSKHEVSLGAGR